MTAHHRLSNFRFSSSASCNPTATRTVDQLREHGRLPRSARVRRQGLEPRTRGLRDRLSRCRDRPRPSGASADQRRHVRGGLLSSDSVHHAGDMDLRRPVDPRHFACIHRYSCSSAREGQADAGAGAGRSLQGARSAWPYRQSQHRAARSRRTPIGPRRASISSSNPAAAGLAPASSRTPAPPIVDQ